MSVVLVRHTTIDIPRGLCYGRIDVPLAASFPTEVDHIRSQLPWPPTRVLCSPAERCRLLAGALAPSGIPVEYEEGLAELSMGSWEGRHWDELRGPEVDAWMADPWRRRPPGGESADDLISRVGVIRRRLAESSADRVLVVTHAGVIRAWRSLAEGRPLAALMDERVPFGSLWPGG